MVFNPPVLISRCHHSSPSAAASIGSIFHPGFASPVGSLWTLPIPLPCSTAGSPYRRPAVVRCRNHYATPASPPSPCPSSHRHESASPSSHTLQPRSPVRPRDPGRPQRSPAPESHAPSRGKPLLLTQFVSAVPSPAIVRLASPLVNPFFTIIHGQTPSPLHF